MAISKGFIDWLETHVRTLESENHHKGPEEDAAALTCRLSMHSQEPESEQELQYGTEAALPPSVSVNSLKKEKEKKQNNTRADVAGRSERRRTHISTGVTAFLMFP